ncbi:NADPH-dependent reductase BacG [Geodia barretti]|uniref:3-oxoacyl-[acyl-carrier-protein] reductase n=1 Tax=Geodia barretti TaxID=519541 RepID=A0AA35QYT4_GEOBA|nr:NADPH-dependent reductase BacG [Geodia barretti]
MDLELNGRSAIVTGGSRGIGKTVARVLAGDGCNVVITGRYADTLSTSAEEIATATGGRVTPIVADMTSTEQVNAMVATAADALGGRVDILVNNAAAPGGLARGSLAEIRDEDVMLDLDTKVMGYLRCARAVAPYMEQQGWGRIVNIGGLSARQAAGNLSAGVRNSGLSNLTKFLAEELGEHGVCVNLVHPGTTRTERSGPMYAEQAAQQGTSVDEVERRVASRNSTRRIVDAEELAWVVAFLASPRSIAISGETIAAGGGAGINVYH